MVTKREIKWFEDFSLWSQEHFEDYIKELQDEGWTVVNYKKNFNFLGLGDDKWEIIVEKEL